MNLTHLTEAQKDISAMAEEFSRKEILPHVKTCEDRGGFPNEIFDKALEQGLLCVTIPENYGGPGLGYLEFILITEKFAWSCPAIAGAVSLNNMIADVLMVAGNEEQKSKYASNLLKGWVGSYALTEPGAGSNVAGIKTSAKRQGSHYVINGAKTWISNAERADFFIVFAKTDETATHKGISAFIVDKGTAGLKVGRNIPKLGQKAFPAAEIFFDDVKVPESSRLGDEGTGFYTAMKVFDRSRPMVAAVAVGASQRCLDEAVSYSKTRETMGKPIASHQMIAAKIAEMGMRSQAARLLTYQSADMLDRGERNTLQAAYAKTFATDTAAWASSEAIQVLGGMGYSTEYPVEKIYRDVKVMQIYEGTNEIQRLIMARELTGAK